MNPRTTLLALVAVATLTAGCSGGSDEPSSGPSSRAIDVNAIEEPHDPASYGDKSASAAQSYVGYFLQEYAYALRTGYNSGFTRNFATTNTLCVKCFEYLKQVETTFADDTVVDMTEPVIDTIVLDHGYSTTCCYFATFVVDWHVDHAETVAADGTVSNPRDDLTFHDVFITGADGSYAKIDGWYDADHPPRNA